MKKLKINFFVVLCAISIHTLQSQDIEKVLNSKWFAVGNGSASVNTMLNVQNWSECSFDYVLSANYASEIWGISIPLQTNYQTETSTLAASVSAFFGDGFHKDKISWRVSLVQNNYWQYKEYNRSTLVLRDSMNFKINKHHQLQTQISFLIGLKSNFMLNFGYNFILH